MYAVIIALSAQKLICNKRLEDLYVHNHDAISSNILNCSCQRSYGYVNVHDRGCVYDHGCVHDRGCVHDCGYARDRGFPHDYAHGLRDSY